MKTCTVCKIEKPLTAYWKDVSSKDRLTCACITCRKESKQRCLAEKSSPERIQERKLKAERKKMLPKGLYWCKTCEEFKKKSLMTPNHQSYGDLQKGLSGYRLQCSACMSALKSAKLAATSEFKKRQKEKAKRIAEREKLLEQGMKKCSECHLVKALDDFANTSVCAWSGKAPACKGCGAIRKEKLHEKAPWFYRHQRWLRLLTRYKITQEDWCALWEKQKGVCAICGQLETVTRNNVLKPLAVDHCGECEDSDTVEVRGLLCQLCNVALGMLGHDEKNLKQAIKYLSQHNCNKIPVESGQ